MDDKNFFTKELLRWNEHDNNRLMPWKKEKDPYKIWISEIILQQTQVKQGLEYYNRFIKRFPNVKNIAGANETEVFKLWEGLGYYSRCKNIIHTAKFIAGELNGIFPKNYEDILKLKGVGSYTASAIASFAYNLPHAVLDGNVFRVLARYFGIKIPIDLPEGKKYFSNLANELLDKKLPGIYNQAIMDFGATICKPLPLCEICPLNQKCIAYLHDLISELPVKQKSIIKKKRWLYYLIIECDKKFYVRKRIEKDIWQNLYEFVLIEMPKPFTIKKLLASDEFKSLINTNDFTIKNISEAFVQQLTHQTIAGQFIHLNIKNCLPLNRHELLTKNEIKNLPFPKLIAAYLKD